MGCRVPLKRTGPVCSREEDQKGEASGEIASIQRTVLQAPRAMLLKLCLFVKESPALDCYTAPGV